MNDYNNIDDKEIRNLLKKRLLEHADDDLLEAEAKLVFADEPVVVPSAAKKRELIKRLKRKRVAGLFKKWILPGTITVLSVLLYHGFHKTNQDKPSVPMIKIDNASEQQINNDILNDQPVELIAVEDTSKNNFIKQLSRSRYRGQIIEKILKENADCAHPILVKDTIVFSPHSPKGSGNNLEIFDNPKDDLLYFEKEHNTVWYKFSAFETGQLTFDIIPVDINDDYDFMLYKCTGGDFPYKVMNKKIKPVRTCISRNDKKLQSKTGLFLDESLAPYIHSGEGASYVKYLNVQKGETFYLLLDNVYNSGNGHTIHFHYKPIKPGEPYVGKSFILANVTFEDSDVKFKPGTGYEKSLDSLYEFLVANPNIKIEIQGHVNTAGKGDGPTHIPGRPVYTDLELSQQRALIIYKILTKRGIDHRRLTTNGYGGMRKRIQLPLTTKECYMNIRIEILITSLDYKKDLERMKRNKNQR